jgi:hypothetical protein
VDTPIALLVDGAGRALDRRGHHQGIELVDAGSELNVEGGGMLVGHGDCVGLRIKAGVGNGHCVGARRQAAEGKTAVWRSERPMRSSRDLDHSALEILLGVPVADRAGDDGGQGLGRETAGCGQGQSGAQKGQGKAAKRGWPRKRVQGTRRVDAVSVHG